MKIVWLSIHFPSFSRSGGDVAAAKFLRAVAATGWPTYSVHIYHSARGEEEVEAFRTKLGLAGVRFVTTAREGFVEKWLLRLFLLVLLPFLPASYSRLMWPRVRRRYRAVLAEIARTTPKSRLLVICDGLQPCALLRGEGLNPEIRYVYRAHNVERDLWRSAAEQRGPFARAFMIYWAWRIERLESWVLRRFDQVHAISAEDEVVLRSLCPEPRKIRLTPVALDSRIAPTELKQLRRAARTCHLPGDTDAQRGSGIVMDSKESAEEAGGLRLLFLGKLGWPPNRDGIAWFLDHVWRSLLQARPDTRLTIVGMDEDRLMPRYGALPRLRFTGHVSDDELRRMLLSHDLLVVPIFSGSGVRVKVLEAALHGLASIGTALGMRGSTLTGHAEFIPADDRPTSWIDALTRIGTTECEAMGERAFAKIHALVSSEAIDKAAADALHSLSRQGTARSRG